MIDLHTHTTASDGTDSPAALVNKAHSAGITTLAITDHDSTSGWGEAVTALRPSLSLVLGAEISTLTLDGISVHMLGLLFDGQDKNMQNMLAESRDTRIPRMRKMIELLAADGINISIEDVMAATPVGATLGRPHLADALVLEHAAVAADRAVVFRFAAGGHLIEKPAELFLQGAHGGIPVWRISGGNESRDF